MRFVVYSALDHSPLPSTLPVSCSPSISVHHLSPWSRPPLFPSDGQSSPPASPLQVALYVAAHSVH